VLQCVTVCCRVLQCVAVCCSVLQCVAGYRSVSQCVAVCGRVLQCVAGYRSVLQSTVLCCSGLQIVLVMKLNSDLFIHIKFIHTCIYIKLQAARARVDKTCVCQCVAFLDHIALNCHF